MRIHTIIWPQERIDHIADHGVTPEEVEEVCDRVAILCKGRLVALDTPLALRQTHSERKVDVILRDGSRHVFNLEQHAERGVLAGHVERDAVASLQTREFNFHEAFLKLTGTAFD